MATATLKKKKGVKQTVKETAGKVKKTVSQKAQKVKTSVLNYKEIMQVAFDLGYNRGLEDADKIPNKPGARQMATAGYGKAIKNKKKLDRYKQKCKR